MKRRLVMACCEQTRDHIVTILDNAHDVKALVRALAQSMAFEKEMQKRFESEDLNVTNANSGDEETAEQTSTKDHDPLSATFLKKVSCAFEPHLVCIPSLRLVLNFPFDSRLLPSCYTHQISLL